MKLFERNKINIVIFFGVALMLSACVSGLPPRSGVSSNTSQASRTASRTSVPKPYVVNKGNNLSPLEQHMLARKMVDPGDTSPTHRYTYLAEDYQQRIAGKPRSKPQASVAIVMPPRKPTRRLASAVPAAKPAPKARVTPAVKPAAKAVRTASKPVSRGKSSTVTAFRVGKHPDKTRIVLDLSANAKFDFQIDTQKNVLVVTLPNSGWSTDEKRVFSSHPLLLAYLAKPTRNGDGTYLAIKMKKKAKVLLKSIYPPASGKSYRLVLDVAPA